ncbi:MAG: NYN domain-containing protein [Bacteroidia bacterium]|nr:NYN domain-containing protein [Bacteroidia bacterium]
MFNKVAILIDGGFYLKLYRKREQRMPRREDVESLVTDILAKVNHLNHTGTKDILYRTYFYHCKPFGERVTKPSGEEINFEATKEYRSNQRFLNQLIYVPQLALRLGELSFDGWREETNEHGKTATQPIFKQKMVDMKIGLDIAWIASKRLVDKIVIVTADSDFVAPMKFARKEGVIVYLEPLGFAQLKRILREHADFVL